MRCLALRDTIMWLGFKSENDVQELDSILCKEYRDVINDEIPDTLKCIEFHCKPTNIPDGILQNM